MDHERINAGGEIYENIGHAFDITIESDTWGTLQAIGIDRQGTIVPVGNQPYDVQITLIDHLRKRQSYDLRADIDPSFPVQDNEWCRCLVTALGRQAEHWVSTEALYSVLSFVETDEVPNPSNSDWSPETDRLWMEIILSAIESADYRHVWDFEEHKQDGEEFYKEWENMTYDSRH